MSEAAQVKCLVWDLDNTLWEGILSEGGGGSLRPGVERVLRTLDERGILHSLASKNDHEAAWRRLEALGIQDYFLVPQINWGAKSASLQAIAAKLNLGIDSLAFVDDQPYEREEVAFACPQVHLYSEAEIEDLPGRPEFRPRFVTEESGRRREMYRCELERRRAEKCFAGPSEDFLRSLGMVLTLRPVEAGDLPRAFELTVRTHQLNTTGITFGVDELEQLRQSPHHLLLTAELEDKFGPYGQIGLALVEKFPSCWHIRLLLMSCRVMGRGVGTVLLHRLMQACFAANLPLRADFKPNGRNDMMLMTYRFAGMRTLEMREGVQVLQVAPRAVPPVPAYITLRGGFAGLQFSANA